MPQPDGRLCVTRELGFAYNAADRVVFLEQGAIYEQGTPQQVLTRPQRPRPRDFLRSHTLFRLPEPAPAETLLEGAA